MLTMLIQMLMSWPRFGHSIRDMQKECLECLKDLAVLTIVSSFRRRYNVTSQVSKHTQWARLHRWFCDMVNLYPIYRYDLGLYPCAPFAPDGLLSMKNISGPCNSAKRKVYSVCTLVAQRCPSDLQSTLNISASLIYSIELSRMIIERSVHQSAHRKRGKIFSQPRGM